MVVPIEKVRSFKKLNKYVGNRLILNLSKNETTLLVTGNKCKIKLGENTGFVKIVGSDCEITVLKGIGSIEYLGNGGKIYLGSNIPEETVTYIGNKGEISFIQDASDINGESASSRQDVPKSDSSINIVNSNTVRIATSSVPKTAHISVPAPQVHRNGQYR